MLLTGSYLLSSLTVRELNLQSEMQDLQKQMDDCQSYMAGLGSGGPNGGVTIDGLMHCPSSMFQSMSLFQLYSNQGALQGAGQQLAFMTQAGMLQGAMAGKTPDQQAMYQRYIFNNLYQQQRERFNEAEKARMNKVETRIRQQLQQKETQMSMVKAQKEQYKQQVAQDAKDSAPHFAGLG